MTQHTRRVSTALSALTALSLLTAGAAFADSLSPDGDTDSVSPQLSYKTVDTPQSRLCSARGTAVDGALTITYAGGSHLQAGEPVQVTFTQVPGITITLDAADLTMPAVWGSGSSHVIDFTTSVDPTLADGVYMIDFDAVGSISQQATVGGGSKFNVQVECGPGTPPAPVNTVPSAAFSTAPQAIDEGSPAAFVFSITDPDAGDAWTFAPGYPDCGPGTASLAAINQAAATGSFTCTFPDGRPQTETVRVQVRDASTAASNVASTQILVNNVAPVVAAPAFTSTQVDCRNTATLSGISFTDPGVIDNPWAVSVSWGDGSLPTTYNAATQGAQPNLMHVYVAPGSYQATVTVTDKDGGSGSGTTSGAGITVNQTYRVGFLAPFDGSSPSKLIVNQMKVGRTVPVKATIYDKCALAAVTDPTKVVTIRTSKTAGTSGNADPVESYADAGSSSAGTDRFRWTTDFWIYNLDSKALGLVVGNTYRVDVYVGTVKATVDTWAVLQPVK